MCGIFVVLSKNSAKLSKQSFEQGLSSISHRGPDESRTYSWENILLGFNRLSIVDESGGSQPIFNEEKNIVLLCNGEIYNQKNLRLALEARGHKFASHSDAEVIVHLYEEDPQNFVSSLEGMFSFVLLDQHKKRLVFARDRLGIKPLLIFEDQNYLALASEAKAFFASGLTRASLDRRSVSDFFVFNYIPGKRTVFRDVYNVEPATLNITSLDNQSSKKNIYWQASFPPASNKLPSLQPHVNQFRGYFEAAVSSHLMSDGVMGSYLSGGIDSTVTTILMKKFIKQANLDTFSIRFQDEIFDESEYFLNTIRQAGFNGHIFDATSFTMASFSKALYFLELPQCSLMDIPMQGLAALVRSKGIKAVLSGEGSDELFGGYIQYTLNQVRRALEIPAVAPLKNFLMKKVLNYYLPGNETAQQVYQKAFLEDKCAIIDRYGTYPAWYPVWLEQQAFNKQFLNIDEYDPLGSAGELVELSRPLKEHYSGIDDFNKSLYLELKTRLPNYILQRADRNSMSQSIELRVPFLDNKVIDFAVNLPPMLKMFGVKEKYILRKAFKNIIPAHISKRIKFGYSAPPASLWKTSQDEINDLLSYDRLSNSGFFKPEVVITMNQKLASLKPSYEKALIERNLLAVMSILILERAYTAS